MKKWKSLAKRFSVLTLTAALLVNTVDLTALEVSAFETRTAETMQSGEKQITVTDFAPLEEGTVEQQLPVGAAESEITFPDSLTVTVEYTSAETVSANDAGEASPAENTVSGNGAETLLQNGDGEPGIMLLASVEPTTKDNVPFVNRSYDETAGKVTQSAGTCTARVLNQAYADAAAEGMYLSIGSSKETQWWVVVGEVTLSDIYRLQISGDVRLVLEDSAKLTVEGTETELVNGAKLTIYGQTNDTGEFIGKSINHTSGFERSASLEINGGTVKMISDQYTAIGAEGGCANVVINGGTVYAESANGAAIGGLSRADLKLLDFGSVTIHGGNVTAVSTDTLAAAIGSGMIGSTYKGEVTITGGTVTATQGYSSKKLPAISTGDDATCHVSNMKITAYGDEEATAKAGTSYLDMEEALACRYIKLTECDHSGKSRYVDGQQIMDGCADCGKDAKAVYTLGSFTLDGAETPAIERDYDGETQNEAAAVLTDADGKPVTSGVTWQWYQNGTAIAQATESSYKTPLKLSAGTYVYQVTATVDGLTLTGDEMTVKVKKRPVGIDWGQTVFYYTSPETEYIVEPTPTNVVDGEDVSMSLTTFAMSWGSYGVTSFPIVKQAKVGQYKNAVSDKLEGADCANYYLKYSKIEELVCEWSVEYFTDKEVLIDGTKDESGSYVGRVRLTAPEGTLLCAGGTGPENAVDFQYYTAAGSHTLSYYLVKEDDTKYRTKDYEVTFTIVGNGSQTNNGVTDRIKDRNIVYFGTYGGKPIPWIVLDADQTNMGTSDGMFVFSRYGLGTRHSGYLDESGNAFTSQPYAGGAFTYWCKEFADAHLTGEEKYLLLNTSKWDQNLFDGDVTNNHSLRNDTLWQDKLFLLSKEEVGLDGETLPYDGGTGAAGDGYFTSEADRALEGDLSGDASVIETTSDQSTTYWLRSFWGKTNSLESENAKYYSFMNVKGDGRLVNESSGGRTYFMRPGANVDFSKIWFLSAIGGKSAGGSDGKLEAYSMPEESDEWKITLLDGAVTKFDAQKTDMNGNTLDITYYNARTGADRYLSAVVEDEDGNVLYYGRLKALLDEADASGKTSLVLPDGLEEGNRVYVYEEQYNGEYLPDYAGAPIQVHQVLTLDVSVTAKENLVYDGTEQELVTAEILAGGSGTIFYRCGVSGSWSTDVPTAKDAGNYTVQYWVQGSGDYSNIGSISEPHGVDVTIAKKELTVTITSPDDVTYGEKPYEPAGAVLNGLADGDNPAVTLVYTGTAYNGEQEDGTGVPANAGEYTVTAQMSDANYVLTGETSAAYRIARRAISSEEIEVTPNQRYFTGKEITLDNAALEGTIVDKKLPKALWTDRDFTLTDSYSNNIAVSTNTAAAGVEITGKGNYTGTRTIPFYIVYDPAFEGLEAAATPEGWTKDTVTVTAPTGYAVCREKTGAYDYDTDFTESFGVDSESVGTAGTNVFYYLKDKTTGTVSDKKKLTVKIDKTAPYFGDGQGIEIKGSFWGRLLSIVTFGLYTKTTSVTVTASDALSGGLKYFYYIDETSDKENYAVLTAEELAAKSFAEAAGGSFLLSDEGNKVVYAYAQDQAGNQSGYICSDGVTVDNTSPTVTLSAPSGAEQLQDTSATAKICVDEEGRYYYVLSATELSAPGAADLKSSADCVEKSVTKEETGKELTLSFTGLTPNTAYYLYAAAEDIAGNESAVEGIAFTTQKTKPYVEIAPKLSGIYGETLGEMIKAEGAKVVAAQGSEAVLTGAWSVTDPAQESVYPSCGDTQAYSLTFTPTGESAKSYGPVTCEAVPQVERKAVTVGIRYVTRSYGYENPTNFGYTIDSSALAAGDSAAALGIVLTTTAERMSDVGTYEIKGEAHNDNYNVSFMGLDSEGNWAIDGHGELVVTQAANVFVSALSCADCIYNGGEPRPWAQAKFGPARYLYAKKTGAQEPEESAYSSDVPKAAGEYYVKAYVEETPNYKGITGAPVTFTIAKAAAPVLNGDNVSVAYTKGRQDVVGLADMLPQDRGETGYAITGAEDADHIISMVTVDEDGSLRYQIKSVTDTALIGKTAKVTVTAEMENYEAAEYTLTVTLTKKKPVALKDGSEVVCTAGNVLRYGARLNELTLNADRAVFVEQDTDTEVAGTLAWALPDDIPAAGTTQAQWRFTPEDTAQYEELTGYAAIVVEKETPTVTAPVTAAGSVVYDPDRTIADLALVANGENGTATAYVGGAQRSVSGTWVWKYNDPGSVIPTVGNAGYEAEFVPTGADAANYETAVATVAVTVEQASAYILTKPMASAVTYGQSLKESALSGGVAVYGDGQGNAGREMAVAGSFAWKDASQQPVVADSGQTEYTVIFTPADTVNYKTVELGISLIVEKAAAAPGMPESTETVANSCKRIGDIALNEGWEWQESDRERVLEEGVPVTATAVYVGADKGNYLTESVTVTITREACVHGQTEIRGVKAATCTGSGYTGDTYCKECGALVTQGTATAALGHSYTEQVTKQPTTTSEGEKTYTCSRCKDSYTAVIAKLPADAPQEDDADDDTQNNDANDSTQNNDAQDNGTQNGDGQDNSGAQGDDAQNNSAQNNNAQGNSAQNGNAQNNNAQGNSAQNGSAQNNNAQGNSAQNGSAQNNNAQGNSAQNGSAQSNNAQGDDAQNGGAGNSGDGEKETAQGSDGQAQEPSQPQAAEKPLPTDTPAQTQSPAEEQLEQTVGAAKTARPVIPIILCCIGVAAAGGVFILWKKKRK